MKRLCIIVPCYNEEATLPATVGQLSALLKQMTADGLVDKRSYLLFVDDGSTDDTWKIITRAAKASPCIRGHRLARNSGHQQALMAGMKEALTQSDAVITIDADLQDDIRVIPEMFRQYLGGSDIVCGVRSSRSCDIPFKRWTARAFYLLMRLAGVPLIANHADFRLMSRAAVSLLLQKYRNGCRFLRGAVMQLGLPVATVSYDRLPRTAGTTKFPLRRMLRFAIDGIVQESVKMRRELLVLAMLFAWSVLVLLLQSADSPLHEPLYRSDSSWLFMCGKAWMNGLLPYVDFTDSKGPLIWLVYGLGYLLSPRSYIGVFWLTCVCYALTLYCHYRTTRLVTDDRRCALAVAMMMLFPYLWYWFHSEVRSEDFAALPVSASLYCMMRLCVTGDRGKPLLRRLSVMMGACFMALVLIKFNLAAMQATIVLAALWCLVRERIAVVKPLLWLACGAGAVALPFLLWFLLTGTLTDFVREYFVNTMNSVAAPDRLTTTYTDELLTLLRTPSRLALFITIIYGGWLMRPRLRRCPWAPLLTGLAFCLIVTRHSLWEYYYNICTTFVLFAIICAMDVVKHPLKLRAFAWIMAAALFWGWLENRPVDEKAIDYPLSRIVKGRYGEQMEVYEKVAGIMGEVEKPRVLNLYGFERGYGLPAEALPAGRYWSYQNGMTPEMEQGHLDILTRGLADFVIVEDMSRCFKEAGIGPHHLTECGYEHCMSWTTVNTSGTEMNFRLYRKRSR